MDETRIVLQGTKRELMSIIPQLMAFHQLLQGKDICTLYPASTGCDAPRRRCKPHVKLYFIEDSDFVRGRKRSGESIYRRQAAQISFRLMTEESETITKAEVERIASRISALFMASGGFVWNKGRLMCAYCDWDKGYQLQLNCRSITEGKRIVEQVLAIQGHTPDWTCFTTIENAVPLERYPETPQTAVIMGDPKRLPHRRPVVDVRFRYAQLKLHGRKMPITLCGKGVKLARALGD